MSSDLEKLQALGQEVKLRRKAKGIGTLKELSARTGISSQYLSSIENAYTHPSRGFVIPSDDVLEKLATELDLPVDRFHALLGRLTDQESPMSPAAGQIAEEYDKMPRYAQLIVDEAVRVAKRVIQEVEASK